MVTIRWSTRCAGGCGAWLTVGARVFRYHRTYWCRGCAAEHRDRCQGHRTGPVRPRERELVEPGLW